MRAWICSLLLLLPICANAQTVSILHNAHIVSGEFSGKPAAEKRASAMAWREGRVFSEVLKGRSDHRWRIEHAQVADIPRFAALGIAALMQPTHATSDMPWAGARVGADRLRGAYA